MFIHPLVKFILVCCSGFLLSFSAPGYDLWFIAWLGLVPLFIIINTEIKLREIVLYSFLFGFSYNFWYLHWLFSIHPLSWLGFNTSQSFLISLLALIVTSGYNSLFFLLFALISWFTKRHLKSPFDKGIPNLLLKTFFWLIVFNKLSSTEFLLGFPWTLIEYSQYKNLYLIQTAEYCGSIFISFLIVFFNLAIANLILWIFKIEKISNTYVPKEPGEFASIIFSLLFILVSILLSLISGIFLSYKNSEYFSNKSLSISLLQGNLPIRATRGMNLDIKLARKIYTALIGKADGVIVIGPEGALPTIYNSDKTTRNWLKNIALEKQSDIICGSYCTNKNLLKNCTVSFSPSKQNESVYEKERLVPFGEFIPFSFLLPKFLKRLADNLIGEGFSKGKRILPVKTSFGKAGVSICFELIFPTIIRTQTLNGANLLINVSDLSWFSNPRAKQQFLAFAVFRAIENRKPFVIATNSGISAFIESTGKIKSQSIPNSQGILMDWVNPNNKKTFYAKYGW